MAQGSKEQQPRRKIDVGARQVGAVYGKALLGAAQTAGQLEAVVAELDTLVSEVLDPHPEFEQLLGSALIKHDVKVGIIDRVLSKRFSPVLVRFLKVVSSHGRLDALRAIHEQVHKQYDEFSNIVRVHMRTATAVNGQLVENLKTTIGRMLNQKLELETIVDPSLIGGVVLTVGDTVYDGSVARQLEQVREQMIHRSVNEIQSRRDRFRSSGGN